MSPCGFPFLGNGGWKLGGSAGRCGSEATESQGTWVAQSAEHLTLDFGSGHDLTVRGIEPHVKLYAGGVELDWDSVHLSLPFTLLSLSLSLSLSKINK